MARTRKSLPETVDVAHLISTGVLASVCPRALIEEVLSQTGKASQRERLLPAPAVVYYVMALALWREAPLEEVLRVVCEIADLLACTALVWPPPSHCKPWQTTRRTSSSGASRHNASAIT